MSKDIQKIQRLRNRQKRISYCGKIILFPIYLLLQGFFGLSRALGFELAAFRILFRPMSQKMTHKEKAFGTYSPTSQDVIICSYFKSGTNWTMQIVQQIAEKGQAEFESIYDVVSWPDAPMKSVAIPLSNDVSPSKTGLRAIKTHLMASDVPYNEKAKYICVVRDPKDVFVSSYFFVRSTMIGKLMPSVSTWLNICLSDLTLHGSWGTFLKGYWQWRARNNVLFLTYEEMKSDLPLSIQKISQFMGVELEKEEFERVAYLSSFKYMKSVDHKFYPGRLSPFSLSDGCMIRAGKKQNSSTLLTTEQQVEIDKYWQEFLEKEGCDFPYEDYYGKGMK